MLLQLYLNLVVVVVASGAIFTQPQSHKKLYLANSMTLPQIETGPSDFRESADFCEYGGFLL